MEKLNNLVVGGVFEDSELIIELDDSSMATLVRERGTEFGKEYGMMVYRYDLSCENGIITAVLNGRNEVFLSDKDYNKYSDTLKNAKLWSEYKD